MDRSPEQGIGSNCVTPPLHSLPINQIDSQARKADEEEKWKGRSSNVFTARRVLGSYPGHPEGTHSRDAPTGGIPDTAVFRERLKNTFGMNVEHARWRVGSAERSEWSGYPSLRYGLLYNGRVGPD